MTGNDKLILLIALFISFYSCTNNNNDSSSVLIDIPHHNIIARIGDKLITVDEFIKRSEYTIRPKYCRGDNTIHKKIILNSLIGEKLLSIDEKNNILTPYLTKYLKGRKEQKMRDLLFYEKGQKGIQFSSETINLYLQTANKKYKVLFAKIPNKKIADEILYLSKQNLSYEAIFDSIIALDSIPEYTIDFFSEDDPYIIENIFGKKLDRNEVIPPFKINDGNYIWIKIKGWVNTPFLTEIDQKMFFKDINEKLNRLESVRRYNKYISKTMEGNKMNLIESTYSEFIKIASEYYIDSINKNNLVKTLWNLNENINDKASFPTNKSVNKNSPFMFFDNRIWTMGEIQELIDIHPLVFRKKKITKNEFSKELKNAIADLMRDYMLTKEAYKLELDREISVLLEEYLWEDHLIASLKKNSIIKEKQLKIKNGTPYFKFIDDYILELQKKHSDKIYINFKRFDEISLSKLDMVALKPFVPYVNPVPPFPVLTKNHNINYGIKLKNNHE